MPGADKGPSKGIHIRNSSFQTGWQRRYEEGHHWNRNKRPKTKWICFEETAFLLKFFSVRFSVWFEFEKKTRILRKEDRNDNSVWKNICTVFISHWIDECIS